MKVPIAAAVAALAGCVSALSGCGSAAKLHVSLASTACAPRSVTAHGKTETRYCGPATATLRLGGTTYAFRYGRCDSDKAIGLSLGVTLGTIDYGDLRTNGGRALFQLQIDGRPTAIETVNASWGGKPLILINTVRTSSTGSGLLSGTFQSSKGAFETGERFSGSWDCGGKLYRD
jgi:hypothetical protein